MGTSAVSLRRIERVTAEIEVVGTAPLIVHRWSEKAKRQMLEAQQGVKTPKVKRDPLADFQESRYLFADGTGDGFPLGGFKKAAVSGAARAFGKSVKMTELRQHLYYIADGLGVDGTPLIRIVADEPVMREDMVRVGMGTDLRYRAMYEKWSALLRIQFDPNMLDLASVTAIVDAGGSNGIGEWRPERSGTFGTFEVQGS